MTQTSRHDAWQVGDSYESYMGRWSRVIAPHFLEWLDAPDDSDWVELGCGTGALSAAILARCKPRSLIAIDQSKDFIAAARAKIPDARAEFRTGDAQALGLESRSRDVVVSALLLNFLPEREKALAEMKRVGRPGATVGFYVWDYPGGGVQLIDIFWKAAKALDPGARALAEDRRFPFCTPSGLARLMRSAGLAAFDLIPIEVPTVFRDFEDYWHPFTLGAGPAPGYCMNLQPAARRELKEWLQAGLPRRADGAIALKARAWAVKGLVS
jgi:SAM-dependent methyltransferase